MITKQQAEVLLRYMIEAAECVQEDHEYRHSDYAGEQCQIFLDKAHTLARELNEVAE